MDLRKFKRPYRLIVLDIDMTLTNAEREVQSDDSEILDRLQQNGIHIALASGRMTHSIRKFARDNLGFETDVIAYNGAMVWVQGSQKPLSHDPLPLDIALSIVEETEELKNTGAAFSINCYFDDALYAEKQSMFTDMYHQRTKSEYNFVDMPVSQLLRNRSHNESGSPTKLIVLAENPVRDQLYCRLEPRYRKITEIVKTDPEYLEFMKRGVDKGVAVRNLMRYYDVPDGLTLVFGDGNNDIPMLRIENVVSFAMNNASDNIKQTADATAPEAYGGIAPCLREIME